MRCCRCKRERWITTEMRSGRVLCDECATEAEYRRGSTLDEAYRNGGRMQEDREPGRDLVTEMRVLLRRPDVLANALADMGVGFEGDEMPDEERN
jgi:hypothetical protein